MTKRERKYHQRKTLNKKGIYVYTTLIPNRKFSMEDLKGTFCLCMPNYMYDREGKIIPPADGSQPTDTLYLGSWVNGKIEYQND